MAKSQNPRRQWTGCRVMLKQRQTNGLRNDLVCNAQRSEPTMRSLAASSWLFACCLSVSMAQAGNCLGYTSNAQVARCAEKLPGHGYPSKSAFCSKMTKETTPQPVLSLESVPAGDPEAKPDASFGTEVEKNRIVESLVQRHGQLEAQCSVGVCADAMRSARR